MTQRSQRSNRSRYSKISRKREPKGVQRMRQEKAISLAYITNYKKLSKTIFETDSIQVAKQKIEKLLQKQSAQKRVISTNRRTGSPKVTKILLNDDFADDLEKLKKANY